MTADVEVGSWRVVVRPAVPIVATDALHVSA